MPPIVVLFLCSLLRFPITMANTAQSGLAIVGSPKLLGNRQHELMETIVTLQMAQMTQ